MNKLFETINPNLKCMDKLEMKSLKRFKGHDQMPLDQGNLYLNGKKIAFISEDAWGGPLIIDFVNKDFQKTILNFIDKSNFKEKNEWSDKETKVDLENYLSSFLFSCSLYAEAKRKKKNKTLVFDKKTKLLSIVNASYDFLVDNNWFEDNISKEDKDNSIIINKYI